MELQTNTKEKNTSEHLCYKEDPLWVYASRFDISDNHENTKPKQKPKEKSWIETIWEWLQCECILDSATPEPAELRNPHDDHYVSKCTMSFIKH
jgi:hypothetical protein